MKLVKVGSQIINMDLVTNITQDAEGTNVFFATLAPQRHAPFRPPANEMAAFAIRLPGDEGAAFWRWAEGQAADAMGESLPPIPPDIVPDHFHHT